MQKMGVFAKTVTIISRNYFQDVRAVTVWLDVTLETTKNRVKFAEYNFDKNGRKKLKNKSQKSTYKITGLNEFKLSIV